MGRRLQSALPFRSRAANCEERSLTAGWTSVCIEGSFRTASRPKILDRVDECLVGYLDQPPIRSVQIDDQYDQSRNHNGGSPNSRVTRGHLG
jgi:hypothetical protein